MYNKLGLFFFVIIDVFCRCEFIFCLFINFILVTMMKDCSVKPKKWFCFSPFCSLRHSSTMHSNKNSHNRVNNACYYNPLIFSYRFFFGNEFFCGCTFSIKWIHLKSFHIRFCIITSPIWRHSKISPQKRTNSEKCNGIFVSSFSE